MPDIPMPPMPTKWIGPTSCGSFVAAAIIALPSIRPRPARYGWSVSWRRAARRAGRVAQNAGDPRRQPVYRQCIFGDDEGGPGLGEAAGVRRLVVFGGGG